MPQYYLCRRASHTRISRHTGEGGSICGGGACDHCTHATPTLRPDVVKQTCFQMGFWSALALHLSLPIFKYHQHSLSNVMHIDIASSNTRIHVTLAFPSLIQDFTDLMSGSNPKIRPPLSSTPNSLAAIALRGHNRDAFPLPLTDIEMSESIPEIHPPLSGGFSTPMKSSLQSAAGSVGGCESLAHSFCKYKAFLHIPQPRRHSEITHVE